ncbi:hypothetical protein IX84_01540 [Phaeodactylibacter xiamenensis]|uniref:Uncharacterized protein n=1 Tax=Phaeodactylibacter xiamenensis TaxID=1524460 RepID=A0A098SC31_9BACT|nr:hypothetical protein IX84_01540 [Phaeodactylibacter xiamenensis]
MLPVSEESIPSDQNQPYCRGIRQKVVAVIKEDQKGAHQGYRKQGEPTTTRQPLPDQEQKPPAHHNDQEVCPPVEHFVDAKPIIQNADKVIGDRELCYCVAILPRLIVQLRCPERNLILMKIQ